MDLYQISTSQFERIWHLYKHEKQFLKKKKDTLEWILSSEEKLI